MAGKSQVDLEEGLAFTPKYDADGLITAVVTDAGSGDVLMVAHMNEEALRRTISNGEAWYYSRSRKALWKKGETSGHVQRVIEMRVDCDQDAILLKVEQHELTVERRYRAHVFQNRRSGVANGSRLVF